MSSANAVSDLERAEHSSSLLAKRVVTVDANGNTVNLGNLTVKVTVSGTTTYIGEAAIGSAQSSAVWRAKKIDESSGMILTWADGNDSFDNVATDLSALSYS